MEVKDIQIKILDVIVSILSQYTDILNLGILNTKHQFGFLITDLVGAVV